MIISGKHRFVFIHIPKCAGTSVRIPLSTFNDWEHSGQVGQEENAAPVRLDFNHIPLFTLREHFGAEFKLTVQYWSFAVIRDPLTRFGSSVSQRLKAYSDQPIQKRSLEDVRAVIGETIDYLSRQPQEQYLLPPEYIHFQKQVDYVDLDGERIVDSLYSVEDIDLLLADVARRVGQSLVEVGGGKTALQANRAVVFRNDLMRRVIEAARPVTDIVGKVLPESAKQPIRDRVYVPRDRRMKALFESEHVHEFIRDYYADDIALYQQVSQRARREA